MTGIEAVSIDLKLSRQSISLRAAASFYNSAIITYLSSILRPVTARSISLVSKARPVERDPNSYILGLCPVKTYSAMLLILLRT